MTLAFFDRTASLRNAVGARLHPKATQPNSVNWNTCAAPAGSRKAQSRRGERLRALSSWGSAARGLF